MIGSAQVCSGPNIRIQDSKKSLWVFGEIFPGKELEGYVATTAPAGKTNVILRFYEYESSEDRYLSLTE